MMKLEITLPQDFVKLTPTKKISNKEYDIVIGDLFKNKKWEEALDFHKEYLIAVVNFSFTKFLIFKSLQFFFLIMCLISLTSLIILPVYVVISFLFLYLANKEKIYFSPIDGDLDLMEMVIEKKKKRTE